LVSSVPQFVKDINDKSRLLFPTVGGLSLFGEAAYWFWCLKRI
jgi:hypothetical protein